MDPFPRSLIRRVENLNLPLMALVAVRNIREYLDQVEAEALRNATELGASADDIAEALGMTPQGVRYKLKSLDEK